MTLRNPLKIKILMAAEIMQTINRVVCVEAKPLIKQCCGNFDTPKIVTQT